MNSFQNNLKISSGIIHTSIKILNYFKKEISVDEIYELSNIFNSNIKYSLIFLEECQFIKRITPTKYFIIKEIKSLKYIDIVRDLLNEYLIHYSPFWTKRIKWGLSSFTKDLSLNEIHCFNEANLLDFSNIDNILWWNKLPYFEDNNLNLRSIGIIGEQLSIKYENEIKGYTTTHVSLLGGFHGYDILSKENNNPLSNIYIECKTTTKQNQTVISITNNEWETAIKNSNNYFFHIWVINTNIKSSKLYVINVDDMKIHIPNPSDSKFGIFSTAEINLTSYINKMDPVIIYENLSIFEYLLQE